MYEHTFLTLFHFWTCLRKICGSTSSAKVSSTGCVLVSIIILWYDIFIPLTNKRYQLTTFELNSTTLPFRFYYCYRSLHRNTTTLLKVCNSIKLRIPNTYKLFIDMQIIPYDFSEAKPLYTQCTITSLFACPNWTFIAYNLLFFHVTVTQLKGPPLLVLLLTMFSSNIP